MLHALGTLLAASLIGLGPQHEDARRFNFLVVLLDDVGIDQLACYGDQNHYTVPAGYPYAYTPNIDALAAGGLRFNQCRAMPVCSATRATLLSGRYPFRHGVGISVDEDSVSPTFVELGVAPAPEPPLLPAVLSGAGYTTGALGKWHLGLLPELGGTLDTHPTDLGFDEWRGTPSNLSDSFAPPTAAGFPAGYYNFWWVEDGVRNQEVGTYSSDRIAARAVDWLRTAPEPYFAYVAFNACHGPLDGSNWPPSQHGFGATPPSENYKNTRFRACLENLDAEIGTLLAAAGPRTVVFLLGDNGSNGNAFKVGQHEPRYPVGHPLHQPGDDLVSFNVAPYLLSKIKNSLYEGGIRVPLIVSGPIVAGPGRVSNDLVDVVDLFATVAARGRGPLVTDANAMDLTPILRGRRGTRSWSLAEHFTPNGVGAPASRSTQTRAFLREDAAHLWKLIHFVSNDPGAPVDRFEFYHLRGPQGPVDPLEQVDLGPSHPEFPVTRQAYEQLVGGL